MEKKINEYPGPYHWYMSRFQNEKYQFCFELARPHLKGRILDIGCGDGRMTQFIAETVPFVVGLDHQQRPLQFAQLMTSAKNVGWVCSEQKSPFANAVFDTITCFEVIEHIPLEELALFLHETRRLLKTGGMLVCSTPNRREFWGRLFGHEVGYKHYQEFSVDEVKKLFNSAGFCVAEIWGVFVPVFPHLERVANMRCFFPFFRNLIRLGKHYPHIAETIVFVCQPKLGDAVYV